MIDVQISASYDTPHYYDNGGRPHFNGPEFMRTEVSMTWSPEPGTDLQQLHAILVDRGWSRGGNEADAALFRALADAIDPQDSNAKPAQGEATADPLVLTGKRDVQL